MNPPLNIEIARMCALTEPLPRAQFWVGQGLWSDGAAFIVTLMLYGEAALSVVRAESASPNAADAAPHETGCPDPMAEF
jgi:hypothetical protein